MTFSQNTRPPASRRKPRANRLLFIKTLEINTTCQQYIAPDVGPSVYATVLLILAFNFNMSMSKRSCIESCSPSFFWGFKKENARNSRGRASRMPLAVQLAIYKVLPFDRVKTTLFEHGAYIYTVAELGFTMLRRSWHETNSFSWNEFWMGLDRVLGYVDVR